MARDTSVQQGSHAHITTAPSTQHTWNTEVISSRYRGNNRHTIALPVEENIDTQGDDFPPYIFSMVEQATGEITWDYWGLLRITEDYWSSPSLVHAHCLSGSVLVKVYTQVVLPIELAWVQRQYPGGQG